MEEEYSSEDFQKLLKINDIRIEYNSPYSLFLNGNAERKIRTLFETGKAMFFNFNLNRKLWGYAIINANLILNCIPKNNLHHKSPFEIFYNKKPHTSFKNIWLHILRSIDECAKKLNKNIKEGILGGHKEFAGNYIHLH